jgi:hypothetical protein
MTTTACKKAAAPIGFARWLATSGPSRPFFLSPVSIAFFGHTAHLPEIDP